MHFFVLSLRVKISYTGAYGITLIYISCLCEAMKREQEKTTRSEKSVRRKQRMKPFTTFSAILFFFISIFHLVRLTARWQIIINGTSIPLWVSIPGFFVAAALTFMLLYEAKK
jgi:hypothetical protein